MGVGKWSQGQAILVHSSNYRLVDQVSLALERGNDGVFDKVGGMSIAGIGPVIEMLSFARARPDIRRLLPLCVEKDVVTALERGWQEPLRVISGDNGTGRWGLLCFRDATVEELALPLHAFQVETQKALRFRRKVSRAKARICGAIKEMVDNIFDHSEAPETGIAAFCGGTDTFEVSIGDAGRGILASLRSNPRFAYLRDAGSAMETALKDRNSRYPPEENRGYGFGTLLRALNSLDAELRFRSGDYALEVAGRNPSQRDPHISQKASLPGFVVSAKFAL